MWRWQRKLKQTGCASCSDASFGLPAGNWLRKKSCQQHVHGGLKMMDGLSRLGKESDVGGEKDGGGEDGIVM